MFALGPDLGTVVSATSYTEPRPNASINQQQSQAAAALSGHCNEDVIAWIKLARSARSIEPVTNQGPGQGHLSPLQIHALFALKDCPDDRILSCLELARHCGLCKCLA